MIQRPWTAVIAALDDADSMRSRVSVYLHPLAGRPIIWHVLDALLRVQPPPERVRIVHAAGAPLSLEAAGVNGGGVPVTMEETTSGGELEGLRAAVTAAGLTVLADGASPLIDPATVARLLRSTAAGLAVAIGEEEDAAPTLVVGEGPALASADDPRRPRSAVRVAATSPHELTRVADRHSLSAASTALRDRLVRKHEDNGVSFLLPATTWIDCDVQIGTDTVVYPGVVIEGRTEIGSECVIGPHSRIVEATIGRGVELKGWNYVARTAIRSHVVLEPYVRRGFD